MKSKDNSDQDDCLNNLQIELPLGISPTARRFTPHPWDAFESTDPYWDELEQDDGSDLQLTPLYISAAPEQSQPVGEQFSSDNDIVEAGNRRHFAIIHPNAGDDTAPQHEATVGEQVFLATELDIRKTSVRTQVTLVTEKLASEHEKPAHWVEKYWVKRGENKYWYYRYRWMFGRKSYSVHLGSVLSPLAREKVELVKEAIASGKSPAEIKQLICSPVG